MNIGQVADATGLTAKAIRHYELLGLVVPERSGNSYRHYSLQDVDELRFLQRFRAVGFSLEESGQLLDLYRDPEQKTAETRPLLMEKLAYLDQQWLALNQVRQTLAEMLSSNDKEASSMPEKEQANAMPFRLVGVSDDE
jgi:MerR family transcriptional regulator, copper efflux regulator